MSPEGTDGTPGLGEISRRLADLVRDFRGVVERLDNSYVSKEYFGLAQDAFEDQLDGMRSAATQEKELYNEKLKNLQVQVDQERAGRIWAFRLAVGAFVTALVAVGVDLVFRVKGIKP